MFSGKVFFAATLALMVDTAAAGIKADCWYGDDCQPNTVLARGNDCTLPPKSMYDNGLVTEEMGLEFVMGEPAHFCGNRKSILPNEEEARLQALQYCFDIGASSACIWGECDPNGGGDSCIDSPPLVMGDPHFKTWAGEKFDYHGVCDLMYLKSASHNVTMHIRTTQRYHYSYVSSAVLEVNGETLELSSFGAVIVNGVFIGGDDELPATLGGHHLSLVMSNKKTHSYAIHLEDGSAIEMKTYKDFVGIKLFGSRGAWKDSVGLMGDAMTGKKLARDGETVLEDSNAFGQEWQVSADEKMLFSSVREPQAPAQCTFPAMPEVETSRRLGETMARAEAEEACKNWHMNKEACISDVMVSGDKDLAANVW